MIENEPQTANCVNTIEEEPMKSMAKLFTIMALTIAISYVLVACGDKKKDETKDGGVTADDSDNQAKDDTDPVVQDDTSSVTTDGGDVVDDSEPVATLCDTYCLKAQEVCALYVLDTDCADACAMFADTGADGDTTGDTVQCRISHLDLASEAGMADIHCPHAGMLSMTSSTSTVADGPCVNP